MVVIDQVGRTVAIERPPRRIVSLVPSITELICDMGLEDSLVGVTKFCVHPIHIRNSKAVVGGTKNVNFKKAEALRPDLILANREENTRQSVEKLSAISPVHVSDIQDLTDCLDLIKMYGEIFEIQETAKQITSRISAADKEFENYIRFKELKTAAYFIWKDPWMVAANGTFINSMLQKNHFKNAFAHLERYPSLDLADLGNLEIDYVFLSSEPYPFKSKHVQEINQILPESIVKLVDGEMFSWYGSRILKAFDYFEKLNSDIR